MYVSALSTGSKSSWEPVNDAVGVWRVSFTSSVGLNVPILVPLFISAFRRANDLALAMESRCYKGGEGRSKMKPLKYNGTDTIAFLYMIIFILLQIILKFI